MDPWDVALKIVLGVLALGGNVVFWNGVAKWFGLKRESRKDDLTYIHDRYRELLDTESKNHAEQLKTIRDELAELKKEHIKVVQADMRKMAEINRLNAILEQCQCNPNGERS